MPQIEAFRGIRYDLGHVGSLGDVVAPPYDVIDDAFQTALYKQHPVNVVRLILNREEPGDDDQSNRYQRAAAFFRNWLKEGVLFTEADPAIYVYHQQFEHGGEEFTRRGFMARIRLERFGEGTIYPHEHTMAGPKQDRLLLTKACQANLSQIFGIYPDAENVAQQLLENAIVGKTPLAAKDHLGVMHRLWPVTDVGVIAQVAAAMAGKPVFVADGHHRYETACNYRDELAAERKLDETSSANSVLMMCVGMHDPGMIVLPTHRLFSGLPSLDSAKLVEKLGDSFTTRIAGEGSDLANLVWEEVETAGQQTLGLYCEADERWVVATLTEAGKREMNELAADQSDDWRGLGVSILHKLVMDHLVTATDLLKPLYLHTIEEVVENLDRGEFQLAAVVNAATLEHVRLISEHGERMPPKSTYFYPKLLSGLVINPL